MARLRLLAGGVRNALRLVRLGGNSADDVARLETLLASRKVASVGELEALLSHAKVTSSVERAALEALIRSDKVQSATEIQTLLDSSKISSATELQGILSDAKIANAGQLRRVLGGTADVAELNRLLALVDDAAQLERFQVAIGNSAEIERLIRTAGLGNPPVADAFRLDRVLAQMGSGTHPIPAIETELAALKRLDSKILFGEPRVTTPPGVAPVGLQRVIRGAHSASILTDPNFNIISQVANADGTIAVKFKKLLFTDPSTGAQTWSKPKSSTLAPAAWSERDILTAGDRIAATPAVSGPRTWGSADGAFMHRGMVNGVQWEVIKDATGKVISSYPTGGSPAPAQF